MAYGFNNDKSKFQLDGILNSFATEESVEQKLSSNIESTATASKMYNVGDYVVVSGTLKKVTSTIAEGQTFNSGNSKDTTVTNELKGATELISSSERMTGETINGKPVYTKTMLKRGKGTAKENMQFNFGVTGIFERLWIDISNSYVKVSDSNNVLWSPTNMQSTWWGVNTYYQESNNTVNIQTNENTRLQEAMITIKYTKK